MEQDSTARRGYEAGQLEDDIPIQEYANLLAELSVTIVEGHLARGGNDRKSVLLEAEELFLLLIKEIFSLETEKQDALAAGFFHNGHSHNPRPVSKDGITAVRRAFGSLLIEGQGQGDDGDMSLHAACYLAKKFFGQEFIQLMTALGELYRWAGWNRKPIPTIKFMRELRDGARGETKLAEAVEIISASLATFDPVEKAKLILDQKTRLHADLASDLVSSQPFKPDYEGRLLSAFERVMAEELPTDAELSELLLAAELYADSEIPLPLGGEVEPRAIALVAEAIRIRRKVDSWLARAGIEEPSNLSVLQDVEKANRYEREAVRLSSQTRKEGLCSGK